MAPKCTQFTVNIAKRGHIEWLTWSGKEQCCLLLAVRRVPGHDAKILQKRTKWWKLLRDLLHPRQWDYQKFRRALSDTERLLTTWIEDQTQRRVPLSNMTVMDEAAALFEMCKEKAGLPMMPNLLLPLDGLVDLRIIIQYQNGVSPYKHHLFHNQWIEMV